MDETLVMVLAVVGGATLVVGLVILWMAKSMLETVTALWAFYYEHWLYLRGSVSETGQGDANGEVTDEHGQAV